MTVPEPAKGGQCASALTCNAAEEAAGWHHGFWWVVLHPLLLIQHPSEWKQRERWGDSEINRVMCQCINIKLIHFFIPGPHCYMEHGGDISLQPPPPAAITTSKHLLHLQGLLCCAWRRFLFQVTHRVVWCICNDRVCQVQCYDFRGVYDS